MFTNPKKRIKEKLLSEFGDLKTDAFDFKNIESYFLKKNNSTNFQPLSDKICADLDFQKLFMYIDRTHSKVGQQYLYNKIRNIPIDSVENMKNEKLLDEFTHNSYFRATVQSHLTQLNDREAYFIASLFQDEILNPPKWYFVVPLLTFTSVLSFILAFFNSVFFL